MEVNTITGEILDACIKVHRVLGPGLFESVYETALVYELNKRNMFVAQQAEVPVLYEGIRIMPAFRADIIVEKSVIIEVKSVEELERKHYKQLTNYLHLSGLKVGLLVNFNVELLKKGFHRIVNNL
jgi:GxxExxY protein